VRRKLLMSLALGAFAFPGQGIAQDIEGKFMRLQQALADRSAPSLASLGASIVDENLSTLSATALIQNLEGCTLRSVTTPRGSLTQLGFLNFTCPVRGNLSSSCLSGNYVLWAHFQGNGSLRLMLVSKRSNDTRCLPHPPAPPSGKPANG
jgi:hypothetical protein